MNVTEGNTPTTSLTMTLTGKNVVASTDGDRSNQLDVDKMHPTHSHTYNNDIEVGERGTLLSLDDNENSNPFSTEVRYKDLMKKESDHDNETEIETHKDDPKTASVYKPDEDSSSENEEKDSSSENEEENEQKQNQSDAKDKQIQKLPEPDLVENPFEDNVSAIVNDLQSLKTENNVEKEEETKDAEEIENSEGNHENQEDNKFEEEHEENGIESKDDEKGDNDSRNK